MITRSSLTVPLAAFVQGTGLYGLHLAIQYHRWPATHPGWLLGLYAVTLFVPSTAQFLESHLRKRSAWILLVALGTAYCYFGWFHGSEIMDADVRSLDTALPLTFELLLLWLLVLPFLQLRLANGRWIPSYQQLFSVAWRNHLILAEAALFTGLFWALLLLWQMLFHMLGIDFFRHLFEKPPFAYPVTSLVFGFALQLIGSLENWTTVVLDQLLNVLKWLGTVAGLILALFTIALLFKLPTLVFAGQRAIGTTWLLWLVAVIVLFVNAAFRDGRAEHPYPRAICVVLRVTMPLLCIVALTAGYALTVRTRQYGLTVERFWAIVAGCFALLYAIGYTAAAAKSGPWMRSIAQVNPLAAVALIVVIAGALSPSWSPYRLAADSQYRMAIRWRPDAIDGRRALPNVAGALNDPFHYLRFEAGGYGREKLHALASLSGPGNVATTRERAIAALAQTNRYMPLPAIDADSRVAKLPVFPTGHPLPDDLRLTLQHEFRGQGPDPITSANVGFNGPLAGLFIDLEGGHQEEFVLLGARIARVYRQRAGQWRMVGTMYGNVDFATVERGLASGDVAAVPRAWADLRIGGQWYRFTQVPPP